MNVNNSMPIINGVLLYSSRSPASSYIHAYQTEIHMESKVWK
jgi:hypothetical protein